MKIVLPCILWLSLLASPMLAQQVAPSNETRKLEVPPGRIELRLSDLVDLPPVEDRDLDWDAKEPWDMDYGVYESGDVCVFCWHKKGVIGFQSLVIDWEKRTKSKITWIITVTADDDGDDDDDDDDDDDGDDDDDDDDDDTKVPPDVQVTFGLGPDAYLGALKIDKAEVKALAQSYFDAGTSLNELSITTKEATAKVRTARESLSSAWDAWHARMQPLYAAAADKHGGGPYDQRDFFWEIYTGLREAAK